MLIRAFDPEIFTYLEKETQRQRQGLLLIPSENYVSRQILEVEGSILSNKYAEGYPHKKWYSGCRYVSEIEEIAIERAKKLFGAEYANVQPHSGSQANMGVYFAILEIGDTILSLDLTCGGHLTHGNPMNFSGKYYRVVHYGVTHESERINFTEVRRLAHQYKPKLIVTGASAYPRIIEFEKFGEIAREIGAYFMADIAHIAGLIVAGLHPSPFPWADFVTTSTHKTLRGPRGGLILAKEKFKEKLNRSIFPGIQGGPSMHVIAAKAVAFKEAATPEFKNYQTQIVANAKRLAGELKKLNFKLVSDGTDNHLMIVDLSKTSLTGREAALLLEEALIYVNKEVIPYDSQSAYVTSGIRLGTPAVTTRGMKEEEMVRIAQFIKEVLSNKEKKEIREKVRKEVQEFTQAFPVPS
jgi:glycine hydroxymethyltransferase